MWIHGLSVKLDILCTYFFRINLIYLLAPMLQKYWMMYLIEYWVIKDEGSIAIIYFLFSYFFSGSHILKILNPPRLNMYMEHLIVWFLENKSFHVKESKIPSLAGYRIICYDIITKNCINMTLFGLVYYFVSLFRYE